ncbi:MAG TPA: macro domain-containing protein [Caulobacteraceae bacterium]|jgi:hypothetical protein|nr:macro domain-containing protein [Caulobacteraceae bacterium]
MPNQLLKSFWVGVKRRWLDGLRSGFGGLGVVWTLTEMSTAAFPAADVYLKAHGGDYIQLMGLLFLAIFLAFVIEPTHVTFKVPTTDTKITLKYGDLFAEDANLLIGVSEFFDGELGAPVSKASLHGQFIIRNFGGSAVAFRAAVDPALAANGVAPMATARPVQPSSAYPIGTTIRVSNGAHSAFLMAMARADHTTYKAASDPPTLLTALKGGLQVVHDLGNGEALAMPLFGNGQSGINLTPQHLLRLLTLALVDFGRNSDSQLPKRVTIVLHDRCFEELDIREIARDWTRV